MATEDYVPPGEERQQEIKLRHRFFSFPFPVQWAGIQIVFLVAAAASCRVRGQPAEAGKQDTTILDEVWPQLTDFSRAADSGTRPTSTRRLVISPATSSEMSGGS